MVRQHNTCVCLCVCVCVCVGSRRILFAVWRWQRILSVVSKSASSKRTSSHNATASAQVSSSLFTAKLRGNLTLSRGHYSRPCSITKQDGRSRKFDFRCAVFWLSSSRAARSAGTGQPAPAVRRNASLELSHCTLRFSRTLFCWSWLLVLRAPLCSRSGPEAETKTKISVVQQHTKLSTDSPAVAVETLSPRPKGCGTDLTP